MLTTNRRPAGLRRLIVNADDFGLSEGVNRGIVEAHERGIVTSASLMVRRPAAAEAAAYGQDHRLRPDGRTDFSLGLHIDLGEWVYRDDAWVLLDEVVPLDDVTAVRAEVCGQLAAFRALVGSSPTHLDSHQHVHLDEPVRTVAMKVARQLGVPLRNCDRLRPHLGAEGWPQVRYCGYFYGQTAEGFPVPEAISVDGLLQILSSLPPGITELGCHPGLDTDLDTMYRSERAQEVRVLCDPRVRSALVAEGIELLSFGSVCSDWCGGRSRSRRGQSRSCTCRSRTIPAKARP